MFQALLWCLTLASNAAHTMVFLTKVITSQCYSVRDYDKIHTFSLQYLVLEFENLSNMPLSYARQFLSALT